MKTLGFFITGTDTGVGKTYAASLLAAAFLRRGMDVGVMKPAESGCRMRKGVLVPADALKLMQAARVRDPLALVNPYRFQQPLAPAIAAELEGTVIELRKILSCYRSLKKMHPCMVVEGAGGIMTPLAHGKTYLDLAAAMGLPVLIVARPDLGTINHTLLTISVLRQRGMTIAGVLINYARDRRTGSAERTGPAAISNLSGVRVLGTIRHGSRDIDAIVEAIIKNPLSTSQRV